MTVHPVVRNRVLANVDCALEHVEHLRNATTSERAHADLDCIRAELGEIRRAVTKDAVNAGT